MRAAAKGLTLVELLIGAALLTAGGGALLLGMNTAMTHTDYLAQYQVAMNAAQGQLEQLVAAPFDSLWNGLEYQAARNDTAWPRGQCVGMGEDRNCNGRLDAGEDLDGDNVLDEPLPGGRLSIMIRAADPRNPANPSLLDLYVAGCWQVRGRRIGEDQNCNGRLEFAEDSNPRNQLMDSPVALNTRIGRRE